MGESSLLSAIEEYEKISIRKTTISSYLHLSYDTLLHDDSLKKRKGALSQRQSEIYGDNLEWFSLDVAELDDAVLAKQYENEPDELPSLPQAVEQTLSMSLFNILS